MTAPTNQKKLHVGQEVVVTACGKTRTATVAKVGRVLVQANGNAHRIDTGVLNSGYSGAGRTLDEQAELEQRTELRARAWKCRHMVRDLPRSLTLDQLQRIVDILEETP
ncbi:beta barrel domain-containing protein [Oerskovia enterophila]|uniref:Uncharacterized protein n=1 Tax=Oerskovia enterophila TaxID=43678 RepID=A0ABX2YBI3_9CELL|nr:hypothetical protein [Oerskovia enterophila]OCI32321.1 hypothetical protein OERS_09300 [Oerskovia enterophila]